MHVGSRPAKRRALARTTRTARTAPPAREEAPAQSLARREATRGGGSQDRARYECACGYAFEAEVTTSVDCPHCGTLQAW